MRDPLSWDHGEWHHLMMTWRRDIGGNFYVDGQLVAEVISPAQSGATDDHHGFYIGRPNSADTKYGRAWYDDLRIYYQYEDASFAGQLYT